MGEGEAKIYYVLTLQGQQGPFDKHGVKELVAAGGARGEDQVRNAFGRNLGTVRELFGPIRQTGSGRVASDRSPSVSGRRAATGSASGRPPISSGSGRPQVVSGRSPATGSGRGAARTSARGRAPAAPPARRRSLVLWIVLVCAALAVAGAAVLLVMSRATPPPRPTPVPQAPPQPVTPPPAPVYTPLPLPAGAVEAQVAIGRVLAVSEYLAGREGIAQAFDGNVDSKWFCSRSRIPPGDQRCGWVLIEAVAECRTVGSYALASANDLFERDAKDWRLVGIAADGSEREIDRRTGIQWTARKQRRHFPLNEVVSFPAYRFDFLAQRGKDPEGIQLSEIELLPTQDDARTRSTSSSP